MKNRRDFIKVLSLGGASLVIPLNVKAGAVANRETGSLKFGLCADVHKDIMHDANVNMDIYGYPIMPSISDKSIAL